jgi:hypothetical protein
MNKGTLQTCLSGSHGPGMHSTAFCFAAGAGAGAGAVAGNFHMEVGMKTTFTVGLSFIWYKLNWNWM